MTSEIRVKIVEIIFHNESNGYTVAIGENDDIECTVVGNLPSNVKGRTFILRGKWTNHSIYGEQFSFSETEEIMPQGSEGILDFLASGILKGIGPKLARSLVNYFGENTLEVIENQPERLVEVPGVGEKKAKSIEDAFIIHKEFAEIALFFQQFGIGSQWAYMLYKQYGGKTIDIIKENPYDIIGDVRGIGFLKADLIAQKLGFDNNNTHRIESGIKYALNSFVSEGHTFAYKNQLLDRAIDLLDVSREDIEENLIEMVFRGDIHVDSISGSQCVYLLPFYEAEQNVCSCIYNLVGHKTNTLDVEFENMLAAVEKHKNIKLSEGQKEAVKAAVTNNMCVITGGPGTGKTTIINAVIQILTQGGLNVAIAAPTGRAAKRITETSGFLASTIHRLLEYSFIEDEDSLRFGRNRENPLDYDAVIIDEASMVDLLLMNALLKALKPSTKLILVGDADQLPSVGAGNVLRDIIASEYVHCVKLTEIFRQARESLIIVNAHRINKGEYPCFNERDKDFFLVRRESEKQILETIKDLCVERLPNYYDGNILPRDIQVLTPVRKGILGCININKELQEIINPQRSGVKEKKFGEKVFREKDKVMQTKNNYSLKWKKLSDGTEGEGVFNGDMGEIASIDDEFNEITVVYDDDRYATYDYASIPELEHAYAVTVHKSQGSEFPVVVIPISWFPPMLATRNLLYTAVTRGKGLVVIVGSENKMMSMIDNNSTTLRNSGLKERLIRQMNILLAMS